MASLTKENGGLTPQDKGEVQAVLDHAEYCQRTLENVAKNFSKKGTLGLMWDSKVPEDGWFCHLFTFRTSNKDKVLAEIETYKKFYIKLSEVHSQIMDSEGKETSERYKEFCKLVDELLKHLEKLSRAAKDGKVTTDSSTVYRQHCEFINKHEKLKKLIMNTKCVALKLSNEQSLAIIKELNTDLQKSKDRLKVAVDKSKELTTELKGVQNEKRTLEQANDLMEEQNRLLLEKSSEQKEKLEDLARANQELKSGQQHMSEELDELKRQMSNMSINQAEELEALRQEKRELEERNERLEQERRDQSRAMLELSKKQEELFRKNEMVWKELKKMQDEKSGSSDTSARHPGL